MQVETAMGRSSGEFTVDELPDAVLARVTRHLSEQQRFTVVEASAAELRLTARPNWATWGARVLLRFVPMGTTSTVVQARWAPALATTVGTWGQGARDLRALEAFARS